MQAHPYSDYTTTDYRFDCLVYHIPPPQLLSKTLSTALFSCLLVPNFYLDTQGGYFDVSSSENPLLHLWYVGVICQVYFVTPWLLFFCRFRRRFLALLLLLVAGILSYLLMRWSAGVAAGEDTWRSFCVHVTEIIILTRLHDIGRLYVVS